MELTEQQEALLDGAEGPAVARCIRTLVEYGEVFGARRLVPIKSAHLAGSFSIGVFGTYLDMLGQLVREGARVRVPTTVNPRPGIDFSLQNRFIFRGQARLERLFDALGVTPSYSCVSYLGAGRPARGDVIAWAESSAVIYANSVLGARTNRNSIMIDISSAVTGLTPEFGFLLDGQRRGQLRIEIEIERMDPPALGVVIGRLAVDRVPVIDTHPFSTTDLKNMGAAMAASGAVALYHVVGLTPEAPSLDAVLDDGPIEAHRITDADLDAVRSERAAALAAPTVIFGCPQMTLDEALAIGARYRDARLKRRVIFHLMPGAREAFLDNEIGRSAVRAGVEVEIHCPLAALSLRMGFGNTDVLTSSGKLGCYLEGARYGTLDDAVAASGGAPAGAAP